MYPGVDGRRTVFVAFLLNPHHGSMNNVCSGSSVRAEIYIRIIDKSMMNEKKTKEGGGADRVCKLA